MSVASHLWAAFGTLAAVGAAISLWVGGERHPGGLRHACRWFAVAAGLWGAGVLVGQAAPAPAGTEAVPLSFAGLPSLLALPALGVGLARLALPFRGPAWGHPPWRSPARVACALADGYIVAGSLFLIGWVTVFDSAYAGSGVGPGAFSLALAPLLADLIALGALMPLIAAAGRAGMPACLALLAMSVADSLGVRARIAGTSPGALAVLAAIAGFLLLSRAPWLRGEGPGPVEWLGRARAITRTVGRDGSPLASTSRASASRAPSPEAAGSPEPDADDPETGVDALGVQSRGKDAPVVRAPAQALVDTARPPGGRQAAATMAAVAAAAAALLLIIWALAGESPSRPVVPVVGGATLLTLAARTLVLARHERSGSWSGDAPSHPFQQLAERTSDAILLCDLSGVIRYASRAVGGFGYSADALTGAALAALLHPEDRDGASRAVRKAVADRSGRAARYGCRVRSADGTWRHVEATVSRYRDLDGEDLLLITARDISYQVALRRQVTHLTFHDGLTGLPNRAYAERRARDLLATSESAATSAPLTAKQAARPVKPAAGTVAGPAAGTVAGPTAGPVAEPVAGRVAGPVAEPAAEPVAGPVARGPAGPAAGTVTGPAAGTVTAGVASEAVPPSGSMSQPGGASAGSIPQLGGAPERSTAPAAGRGSKRSGAAAGTGGQALAGVIFLDLDGFTAVNDEIGHSAGDLLLAQVAHRLRATAPWEDTVARWGGDEFAVLVERAAPEEIVDLAEQLAKSVSGSAFRAADRDVPLTASVGVAFSEEGPAGYVWRDAHVAMSRAKLLGGGRVEVFGGPPGNRRDHDHVSASETRLLSS